MCCGCLQLEQQKIDEGEEEGEASLTEEETSNSEEGGSDRDEDENLEDLEDIVKVSVEESWMKTSWCYVYVD